MNHGTEHLLKIRKSENLHILLWLIKDSCWMMDFKMLGTFMVLPTVAMALRITWMTRKFSECYINLAVLFWILANAAWMLMEFYNAEEYKYYTALPFGMGFLSVFWYYFRLSRKSEAPLP